MFGPSIWRNLGTRTGNIGPRSNFRLLVAFFKAGWTLISSRVAICFFLNSSLKACWASWSVVKARAGRSKKNYWQEQLTNSDFRISRYKRSRSDGFDNCDQPSNLTSNRWFFGPHGIEIWWMTSKTNRAPLLYYVKAKLMKLILQHQCMLSVLHRQYHWTKYI